MYGENIVKYLVWFSMYSSVINSYTDKIYHLILVEYNVIGMTVIHFDLLQVYVTGNVYRQLLSNLFMAIVGLLDVH